MTTDPTTLAVVQGSLQQVVEEMDAAFVATAFSPVISDAWDRASGIYDGRTGEVIVQGETGLPLFIATMQFTVQAVMAKMEEPRMGDIYIINDPYEGGTHLMDVRMVAPVFHQEKLLLYVANTGHWPDIGGMAPGGWAASAREIYQEGVRIPPLLLRRDGETNHELLELLYANVRGRSGDRRGDVEAQLAALELGLRRLGSTVDRFGSEVVLSCVDEFSEQAERLTRERIQALPNGSFAAEDYLDNDGIEDRPVLIALDLTIDGDEMFFDFARSAEATQGPVNCPYPTTVTSCAIALKHLFPDIPINAGFLRPLHVKVPDGSVLNPSFPKPVSGSTTETPQRVIDVVLKVFLQIEPDLTLASCFSTGSNHAMAGTDPESGVFAFINFFGGGYGGSSRGNGLTNGATLLSVARTPSLEVMEQRFPIRFKRFAIREDSAGAGMLRGGFGIIAEFELVRGEATLNVFGDRTRLGPPGAIGGHAGLPARHTLLTSGEEWEPPMGAKVENVQMQPGDSLVIRTPGGGGFGDPRRRDPARVADDIRNGYISKEAAMTEYGVQPWK